MMRLFRSGLRKPVKKDLENIVILCADKIPHFHVPRKGKPVLNKVRETCGGDPHTMG